MFRKGDPVVEYRGELHCLGSSARKVAASRREENNFNRIRKEVEIKGKNKN